MLSDQNYPEVIHVTYFYLLSFSNYKKKTKVVNLKTLMSCQLMKWHSRNKGNKKAEKERYWGKWF